MTVVNARLASALSDRYRIERELGQGGMATVYLAEDLKHDRKVAIKVLHPELSAVIGVDRFLSEIKTTASLQHPHILGLIDSGEADGLLYYVMPFIEGETLRGRLNREKQLPIDDAVRMTKEVAAALEFAHKRGIIHRDIKPENILLQDGQALVADFGIALAVQQAGASRKTQTGMSLGTPAYMSPEQAMGERDIGPRSDVYALGAMTFEMLTGEPPFSGPNSQAIVAKVLTEPPPLLRPKRATVSPAIEYAVLTALQKLPADRFGSAKDFADALEGKGYAATAAMASARLPRPSRLSRRAAIAAIAAIALLLTAAGMLGWYLHRAPAAPVRRYAIELPPNQPMEWGRIGTNIDLSPDGSKYVYVGPGDQGGGLWLRQRDRLEATLVPGSANAINPRFSPDGRQIAFSTGSVLELKVAEVDGGTPVTIARGGSGASGGVAWGDDGWIYFDAVPGLSRVRPNGDSVQVVVPIDATHGEAGQAWPEPMPGGRWLIYRTRRSNSPEEFDIGVSDLKTGTRRVLTKGVFARRIAPGLLGIVRADGVLTVVSIDERTMTLKGTPAPVLEGIRTKLLASVDLTLAAGTLMYVRGGANVARVSAVWVTRDGAAKLIEPPVVVTPANNRGLALSPDGRRLAVDMVGPRSTDLWVKELPAGPFSRLTFEGLENTRPSWTPDGQSVLYILNRGSGVNTTQVWRKKADGSAPAESVYATSRSIVEAIMSRDGQWLIYRVNTDSGGADIFGVRLGRDTTPVPLVTGPFAEASPALSPDGRWLAYVSSESGNLEVYVRPFPDVSRARWQVSTGGGSAPRWAHSGRELFFVRVSDMMVAPVTTTGTTFSAGTPRKLFSGFGTQYLQGLIPYYDVALDDNSFLLMGIPGGDSTSSQLITVENWLGDVRTRLAAASR